MSIRDQRRIGSQPNPDNNPTERSVIRDVRHPYAKSTTHPTKTNPKDTER